MKRLNYTGHDDAFERDIWPFSNVDQETARKLYEKKDYVRCENFVNKVRRGNVTMPKEDNYLYCRHCDYYGCGCTLKETKDRIKRYNKKQRAFGFAEFLLLLSLLWVLFG